MQAFKQGSLIGWIGQGGSFIFFFYSLFHEVKFKYYLFYTLKKNIMAVLHTSIASVLAFLTDGWLIF